MPTAFPASPHQDPGEGPRATPGQQRWRPDPAASCRRTKRNPTISVEACPRFNKHFEADGETIYRHACALGCEGIVSKRLGSPYRAGRVDHWLKIKNPAAPAVKREAEEQWRK
jgi:ATP-dependent DNA ligase